MIPKIIHYCWFGNNPLPEYAKKNIKHWQTLNPDFEVVEWNESNFEINNFAYTKSAYDRGLFAFVSDYVRLYVLKEHGGIYLDTDVEMIKPIDDILLSKDAFIGLEDFDAINTGLIYGTLPKHKVVLDLLNIYNQFGSNIVNGRFLPKTCVKITTDYFRSKGFKYRNKLQVVAGTTIFPTDYFCPQKYGEEKLKITNNTYTIHKYSGTWLKGDIKAKQKMYRNVVIGRRIKHVIGVDVYNKLYAFYSNNIKR